MRFSLFLILAFLIPACGESPYPIQPPEAPGSQNPENVPVNPVQASLSIANIQRNFGPEDNVSCSVNALLTEAVVIFSNQASSSSFSIRMQNVGEKKSTRWLASQNTGENVLITLGGDTKQNNYQMARDDAGNNCWVTTEIVQGNLNGYFQCEQLTNRNANPQAASGSWACRVQSSTEWRW